MNTSGLLWFSLLAAVAILFIVRQIGLAHAPDVSAALRDGAFVIDVREPAEFARGSIPGARNIPLGSLPAEIERLCPERSHPILLHCHSGARSAAGAARLGRMGYTRVANLGSLARAERLLREAGPPP